MSVRTMGVKKYRFFFNSLPPESPLAHGMAMCYLVGMCGVAAVFYHVCCEFLEGRATSYFYFFDCFSPILRTQTNKQEVLKKIFMVSRSSFIQEKKNQGGAPPSFPSPTGTVPGALTTGAGFWLGGGPGHTHLSSS